MLIFVFVFFFTWEQYHRRLLLLLQTWHSEAGAAAAAVAERNLPQLATQHGGPCPKSHHELVMDICPTNTATAELISWPRTHLTPAAPRIDSLLLYFILYILGFIFFPIPLLQYSYTKESASPFLMGHENYTYLIARPWRFNLTCRMRRQLPTRIGAVYFRFNFVLTIELWQPIPIPQQIDLWPPILNLHVWNVSPAPNRPHHPSPSTTHASTTTRQLLLHSFGLTLHLPSS